MSVFPPDPTRGSEIESRIDHLLEQLSLEEKVYMMSGHGFLAQFEADGRSWGGPYQAGGGNDRLGLPALRFSDGPRGIAAGRSTCFPVSMARGASWDIELEQRIGEAIGRELRAQGGNLYGGVCINLLRHPAWGRAQETYGEDPCHVGEMGAALVRGVQRHHVIATVKHFAANSIENARFKVDVELAPRALREVYLPHFRRCVEEGVGSVMSAYNKVNGDWCGHSQALLRKILKEEWGFQGFVHSDWGFGVHGPDAAAAGLDVENPEPIHFGARLMAAIEAGEVPAGAIDDAARRILRTLLVFTEATEGPELEEYGPSVVACPAHIALARRAAEESAVLLQNERPRNSPGKASLLPLERGSFARLAVIGPLAREINQGDVGSSLVRPPSNVTPLDGIETALAGEAEVLFDDGGSVRRAAELAARADVAVVVVGTTPREEGEFIPAGMMAGPEGAVDRGGDRDRLELPAKQEELVLAIAAVNPRTVVAMIGGSAFVIDRWRCSVPAILMLWYAGMEGGTALARLLLGEVSPSGKLPFTLPESAEQLPFFDKDAERIEYGLYHGYTWFDREGLEPAFGFGHGLSYTRFRYGAPSVDVRGDEIEVRVELENTGMRAGAEVVQLYAGSAASEIDRPRRKLVAFRKVRLEPGKVQLVSLAFSARSLSWWDEGAGAWQLEAIPYTAWVGGSSRPENLQEIPFVLE